MIITDKKSRFMCMLRQISNIRHRQSETQYLEAKALRIILPCALCLFFLLFAGIGHVWAKPTAGDDDYTVNEDETLLVTDPNQGVLSNDSDVDGDTLKAIKVSGPGNGTLDLDPNTGSFTYIPFDDFNGTDKMKIPILFNYKRCKN